MTFSLRSGVQITCAAKIEEHAGNCSGFVQAVCDALCIFVPSGLNPATTSRADDQIEGLTGYSFHVPELALFIGRGSPGEANGMGLAFHGQLIICGLTSAELNAEASRRKRVVHGHVAILTGNRSATGWPEAFYGVYGSPDRAGKPGSLSNCFRRGDRDQIAYFRLG